MKYLIMLLFLTSCAESNKFAPNITSEELAFIQCQARGGKWIPKHKEPNPYKQYLNLVVSWDAEAACEDVDYRETQCLEAGGRIAVDDIFNKKYCKLDCSEISYNQKGDVLSTKLKYCSKPI